MNQMNDYLDTFVRVEKNFFFFSFVIFFVILLIFFCLFD